MKRRVRGYVFAGVVACAVLAGFAAARARTDPSAAAGIAGADIDRRTLPGLSVAILDRGGLVLDTGFGRADLAAGIDATASTVYALGSISKQFTATAIMLLVERGKVALDRPITTYLATGPAAWRAIEVRHLLAQTSGLREFLTLAAFQRGAGDLSRPASELFDMIAAEPLDFVPGERWAYSNSNYTLLALIVERVAGVPYDTFLEREFFDPLELTSLHHCPSLMASSAAAPSASSHRYAVGYRLVDGTLAPAAPENMNWARGDGGLCGTAGDLVRWSRALARGEVVSTESYRRMVAADRTADGIVPDYGFGLSLVPLDGRVSRVSHHGEMPGASGMLSYYPERDLAIAVLVNRGGGLPEVTEKRISRAMLGLDSFATDHQGARVADADRYAGDWDIGIAEFPVRFVAHAAGLRVEMPPPGFSGDLVPMGAGLFAATSEPDAIQVLFTPSSAAGDKPDRMRLLMAEMHWYGRRVR
jgi:CubicO group peptidase (beta-lactamase class C family)